MVFRLQISTDNVNFQSVDLFPNQELEYNVDFYDSLEVNQIKLPFSSSMRIPLTDLNKSSSRFNYDPFTSDQSLFPRDDFYFKITIFRSTDIVIQGILNVTSIEYNSDEPYIEVELKDYVSKYISDLKDASIAEVYDAEASSWKTNSYNPSTNLTMGDFFDSVANGGERGTLNQNPSERPIIFPYIDFCNDVKGKFGYGARQFTEYGSRMDRAGIVPVFSVKYFLKTIGDWLTSQGFNTRVDSKLFGLNYTEYDANFEAEKLHMLIPCKLEADKDTNTRTFHLNQAPFWCGVNENMQGEKKFDNTDKDFITNYFFHNETFGNYGAFTNPDPEDLTITDPVTNLTDYGLDVTNAAYPEGEAFGYERGYFAPHMSFDADIDWLENQSFAVISDIRYEIPVLKQDDLVHTVYPNDPLTDMTFGVFIGIAENGELVRKIRLQDSSGNDIVLEASEATAIAGNSNKKDNSSGAPRHYFKSRSFNNLVLFAESIPSPRDTLQWLDVPNMYLPEGETIEINSEVRYSINYFVEPLSGTLVADVGAGNTVYGTVDGFPAYVYNALTAPQEYNPSHFKKAITRVPVDHRKLDIEFTANANFNPYFTDDEYNIKDSLENTCKLTPLEVLTAICKRFACGIYYEYDSVQAKNVLRVDPLHIVRNGSENINQYVDDLKSVKVFLGGDKFKNITINNKDYDLYFDDKDDDKVTIGSTTQELNSNGVSDLKVDLESSVYYKSVCGEETSFPDNDNLINGIVSQGEIAFTPNLFTKHQDVGLRFAYVDKPIYRSMIKRPRVLNSNDRPNIFTITQRIYEDWTIHTFNGRLRHVNIEGFNLLAEDENGETTDYYDLYVDNEKIKYSDSTSIEFDMVVPTEELSSLDFFFQTLSCSTINSSNILVKSAEGEVFEDFAYLTIKGILQ